MPERGVVVTLSEARKLGNPTGEIAARKFVAHRAFAPEESNDAVYADAIAPLVACVQSGGAASRWRTARRRRARPSRSRPSSRSRAPRCSSRRWLSCFEICGEKCSDLLTPGAAVELCDDGTGAVVPRGLSEFSVATIAELEEKLAAARGARDTQRVPTTCRHARTRCARSASAAPAAARRGARRAAPPGRPRGLRAAGGSERRAPQRGQGDQRVALGAQQCLRIAPSRQEGRQAAARAVPPFQADDAARPFLDDEPAAAGDADADRKALGRSVLHRPRGAAALAQAALGTTLEYAMQMIIATRAEQERAGFSSIEKWPPKKVVEWCKELDGGKYAEVAHAFARCSGKLSCGGWAMCSSGSRRRAAPRTTASTSTTPSTRCISARRARSES